MLDLDKRSIMYLPDVGLKKSGNIAEGSWHFFV